jgi:CPA2 family monovalent cation:H+ antiporter-2
VSDKTLLFLELGGLVLVLGVLARLAAAIRLSPIPLYLLAGLAVGKGGLVPLVTSDDFVEIGADIGIVLLLLMLGLEYSGRQLIAGLRTTAPAGLLDLGLNFTPGLVAGLLLGLGAVPSLFLGGVTYISSSGVAAKLVGDLGWLGNRETPVVLSILVFEDLVMAVALPVLGAVALGGTLLGATAAVAVALTAVVLILALAVRHGDRISHLAFSGSDEVNLLTLMGITLVVAGAAEHLHVSAAVGAFLVGIGVSGKAADQARVLISPLRDLFAAVFFVFFGLSIDAATIPAVLLPVSVLVVVSALTKVITGGAAAAWGGVTPRGRRRAGTALIARGEFSIVIAGLGLAAGGDRRLAPLAAAYVLLTAVIGPIAARLADRPTRRAASAARLTSRIRRRTPTPVSPAEDESPTQAAG